MKDRIREIIEESIETKKKVIENIIPDIEKMAQMIISCYKNGNRIYLCGNGGSACDAMHFAEELVARYEMERPGLPAHALTDSSAITCWANDYSFDTVFERKVSTYGKKGDILVAISTSGNSTNIINAVNKAKEIGMDVIGLSGKDGGKIKDICDLTLIVPSESTARIQESHITIIHIVCELIEKALFEK